MRPAMRSPRLDAIERTSGAGAGRDAPPARTAARRRRAPAARPAHARPALGPGRRRPGLGAARRAVGRGHAGAAAARRGPLRLPHRAGGADQRAQARRPGPRACPASPTGPTPSRSRSPTTATAPPSRSPRAAGTGSWASASASRSWAARSRRGSAGERRLRRVGSTALRGRAMIRVLLADDQSLVRTGFRMILRQEPELEVVGEAGDGAEAVTLATTLTPDVVLMDVRMPEARRDRGHPPPHGRAVTPGRARADHVRPRRLRLRGAAGRRERLPAQGRARGPARRRHPHRGRRRLAVRTGRHPAADRALRRRRAARTPPMRPGSTS